MYLTLGYFIMPNFIKLRSGHLENIDSKVMQISQVLTHFITQYEK